MTDYRQERKPYGPIQEPGKDCTYGGGILLFNNKNEILLAQTGGVKQFAGSYTLSKDLPDDEQRKMQAIQAVETQTGIGPETYADTLQKAMTVWVIDTDSETKEVMEISQWWMANIGDITRVEPRINGVVFSFSSLDELPMEMPVFQMEMLEHLQEYGSHEERKQRSQHFDKILPPDEDMELPEHIQKDESQTIIHVGYTDFDWSDYRRTRYATLVKLAP